jgi:FXSXX-COOH protein
VPRTDTPRTVFLVTTGRNTVANKDQVDTARPDPARVAGATSGGIDPVPLVPDIAALSLDELDGLDNTVLQDAIRRLLVAGDRSDPPVAGFNSAI